MNRFMLAAIVSVLLAACASDPAPNAPVLPNPVDTLRAKPDSVLLFANPSPRLSGTLEGAWTTIAAQGDMPSVVFSADSCAAYGYDGTPGGRSKYHRARAWDVRILDDGRVWFDYEQYAVASNRHAMRFCGTITGDTLRGSGWIWPMSLGERMPGSYVPVQTYVRQR